MNCGHVVVTFVVATTVAPCVLHYASHGEAPGLLQTSLVFFCALNLLICLWELALCYNATTVARDADVLRAKTPDTPAGRWKAVRALVVAPATLSPRHWSRIWSTYALYDPQYADSSTWGFWIDIGNGHTTLLPSLLWVFGTIYPIIPPRALGILSLLVFYQELYGTLVYFASFLWNKRYVGKTTLETSLFVGLSNGIWIIGPLLGAYASLRLIYDNDFSLFRPPTLL